MGHEVEGQTFGNYSGGLALKGLREAINHSGLVVILDMPMRLTEKPVEK